MDRTERFYRIELLIKRQSGVSFEQLLSELEVSPATLKRDLQYLRDRMDAPIVYARDDNVYRFADAAEAAVNGGPSLRPVAAKKHELPGVCSHYVIDRDGTVYDLVPTSLMCRHTVGLNWTAIGIEHVGQSDADLLGNPAQLRASLRLTRMLQGRFGIATKDVIGHAESLSSPYHRERVASLRTQTHGDLAKASMDRYRRALAALPAPASLR